MNLSWPKLVAFGLFSLSLLGFLAWYDALTPGEIDRHTGWRLTEGHWGMGDTTGISAQQIIDKARARGDARQALDILRAGRRNSEDWPLLTVATFALEAELLTPAEALEIVPDESADRDTAQLARERLARRLEDGLPINDSLAALRIIEADSLIGEDTEAFFQPLFSRPVGKPRVEEAVERHAPPDLVAAMAIATGGGRVEYVTADVCMLVARSFRAAERPRARVRWLLRAMFLEPGSEEIAVDLASAYLEYGRQLEAYTVLDVASESGVESDRILTLRSRIASWLSLHEEEVAALSKLIDRGADSKVRRRLIDLYARLGRHGEALPHAARLAREERTTDSLVQVARLAFSLVETDMAFDLMEEAVSVAEDPRPWQEALVDLYLQDLRVDSAIRSLFELHSEYPEGGYEPRLEELLRRRDRREDLLALLVARLEVQENPDPSLEHEVIALCEHLGQVERGRELLLRRLKRITDPGEFFEQFPFYAAVGLPHLPEYALLMAQSPDFTEEHVVGALDALDDLAKDHAFQTVALNVAERFPAHPSSVAFRQGLEDGSSLGGMDLPDLPEIDDGPGPLEAKADELSLFVLRNPDDAEARRELANLLEVLEHPREAVYHWQVLTKQDGPGSQSEDRLLKALDASGMDREALALIAEIAQRPGVSVEERARYAERFFTEDRQGLSLILYRKVLEEWPDDVLALTRVGQMLAWGNDPFGAIPYLERAREIGGPQDGEVEFILGECYWGARFTDKARAVHEEALTLLRSSEALTLQRESMVAKILARFGQGAESRAIYDRIIELDPDNQDLKLDYVDALLILSDVRAAREILERARPIAPESRRILRVDGYVALLEGRPEAARKSLARGRELWAPDAGISASLGEALSQLGRLAEAEEAFDEVLFIQPDNENVAWIRRQLHDRLASPLTEIAALHRQVGQDRALVLSAAGSALLDGDRWRVTALLSNGDFEGQAIDPVEGQVDVEGSIATLALGTSYRLSADLELGGGLMFSTGRGDAGPVGLWAEGTYLDTAPFLSASLRLFLNEPFTDPAAAAGLSGAKSGFEAEVFREGEGAWWWTVGRAGYRSLAITEPGTGDRVENGQALLELLAGAWIRNEGPQIVADRLRPLRSPMSRIGTTMAGEPPAPEGPRIGIWLAYTGIRLLGDQHLNEILPVGEKFDYVTLTARAEDRVTEGLFVEGEIFLGTDLSNPGLLGGLLAGLAYRPSPEFELRLRGNYGPALGREGDEDSVGITLALSIEW